MSHTIAKEGLNLGAQTFFRLTSALVWVSFWLLTPDFCLLVYAADETQCVFRTARRHHAGQPDLSVSQRDGLRLRQDRPAPGRRPPDLRSDLRTSDCVHRAMAEESVPGEYAPANCR